MTTTRRVLAADDPLIPHLRASDAVLAAMVAEQERLTGKPFPQAVTTTSPVLPMRFLEKVNKTEGCWLWTGDKSRNGYGRYWHEGQLVMAHRFAYEALVGPIPEGMQLDHVKDRGCSHRNCVNPAHLEPVTSQVNTLRGDSFVAKQSRQTHCIHGHPFDETNTLLSHGRRNCRTCMAERKVREKQRRQLLAPVERGLTHTIAQQGVIAGNVDGEERECA